MQYTIVVLASPQAAGARSALQFARALLAAGHEIYRVFFYGEGVLNGSSLSISPQGESEVGAEWAGFVADNQLDAVFCIASALRRGIINSAEAERYGKPHHNLADAFELAGLGQLTEAAAQSDRLVTFAD